ncbi:DUF3466 family protein [Vibrio lamellibrachiae]|uniref:DUF3466 family protein n=1 Tax=Vibrio lamellibrachiae TaxID=2910253 RepID=UPI003D0E0037
MSSKTFKLSTIAATVLAATSANAALYTIVEVPHEGISSRDNEEVHGVAIQPGVALDNSNPTPLELPLGCFDTDAVNCVSNSFKLAGESRISVDGVSYREESPFGMDRGFSRIQDYDDFKYYCYRELLYSTCETWADEHWKPWNDEKNGSTTSNSLAFVESGAYTNKFNNVINSLTESGLPVGNRSIVGGTRNEIVSPIEQAGSADNGDWKQGRAWAVDSTDTFSVGSIATSANNNEGEHHSSKAAIWRNGEAPLQLSWQSGVPEKDGELLAQGSLRDVVVKDNNIYAVGYNTFKDDNYYNASIFIIDEAYDPSTSDWTTLHEISGAQQRIDGDTIHSNSVATGINENLLVIGTAKRSGYYPQNGAAGNRLFVSDAGSTSPSATFLSGGIFFDGAGGKAGAVNNYNEIVGQIDAEDTRENNGKPRRLRGFIYPYDFDNTNDTRRAIFQNKAQYLDNLTNTTSANSNPGDHSNQFRIINATDINDAGVISATAIKCDGGYDNTTHNSYCGGGSKTEETVAVKLIPIQGATSSDIVTRGIEEPAVERQGGSIGWAMFALFGLLGFRRK